MIKAQLKHVCSKDLRLMVPALPSPAQPPRPAHSPILLAACNEGT